MYRDALLYDGSRVSIHTPLQVFASYRTRVGKSHSLSQDYYCSSKPVPDP